MFSFIGHIIMTTPLSGERMVYLFSPPHAAHVKRVTTAASRIRYNGGAGVGDTPVMMTLRQGRLWQTVHDQLR
ncbi:hypothetical protein BIFGAL_02632 [Bifidobacterium gallicum DSM 20093 = LMG 11596]|uniref:Uncharacterized protein n=1 Tax=Bifidobacterium gallicum DSM 20093 = LMG 11596 TaxID=561180 RepID=D1NS76_9BIFI|nr:hypothetical protein BIFGAL_02632 [Bifidobacterium gallicum DSM 20093 = LMG 11596]